VGAVDMFVLSDAYVDAVRAAPAPAEAAARAKVVVADRAALLYPDSVSKN
jgi:hypothetical protein